MLPLVAAEDGTRRCVLRCDWRSSLVTKPKFRSGTLAAGVIDDSAPIAQPDVLPAREVLPNRPRPAILHSGLPARAPLAGRRRGLAVSGAAKGADASAIADGGHNMKMAESMVPPGKSGEPPRCR